MGNTNVHWFQLLCACGICLGQSNNTWEGKNTDCYVQYRYQQVNGIPLHDLTQLPKIHIH